MNVGIVGMGYVGSALREAVRFFHGVVPFDVSYYEGLKEKINKCDMVFVCVPTPLGADGLLDTSAVEEVLDWIDHRDKVIVVRSTMPVDYKIPKWNVVYQPEFIGESTFAPWRKETDCKLVVAGGDNACVTEVLWFWKPILGPEVQYIATDWRTAAEIKFAVNCHGAVKTAFWHEYLGECIDPDAVRNAVMNIPWIGAYHTLPLNGVGGKCFPKDATHVANTIHAPVIKAALEYVSEQAGINSVDNRTV